MMDKYIFTPDTLERNQETNGSRRVVGVRITATGIKNAKEKAQFCVEELGSGTLYMAIDEIEKGT